MITQGGFEACCGTCVAAASRGRQHRRTPAEKRTDPLRLGTVHIDLAETTGVSRFMGGCSSLWYPVEQSSPSQSCQKRRRSLSIRPWRQFSYSSKGWTNREAVSTLLTNGLRVILAKGYGSGLAESMIYQTSAIACTLLLQVGFLLHGTKLSQRRSMAVLWPAAMAHSAHVYSRHRCPGTVSVCIEVPPFLSKVAAQQERLGRLKARSQEGFYLYPYHAASRSHMILLDGPSPISYPNSLIMCDKITPVQDSEGRPIYIPPQPFASRYRRGIRVC